MTDRVKGLIVTFDQDIRVDDVRPIIAAIQLLPGVVDVSGSVSDIADHMARTRIKTELLKRLYDATRDW